MRLLVFEKTKCVLPVTLIMRFIGIWPLSHFLSCVRQLGSFSLTLIRPQDEAQRRHLLSLILLP